MVSATANGEPSTGGIAANDQRVVTRSILGFLLLLFWGGLLPGGKTGWLGGPPVAVKSARVDGGWRGRECAKLPTKLNQLAFKQRPPPASWRKGTRELWPLGIERELGPPPNVLSSVSKIHFVDTPPPSRPVGPQLHIRPPLSLSWVAQHSRRPGNLTCSSVRRWSPHYPSLQLCIPSSISRGKRLVPPLHLPRAPLPMLARRFRSTSTQSILSTHHCTIPGFASAKHREPRQSLLHGDVNCADISIRKTHRRPEERTALAYSVLYHAIQLIWTPNPGSETLTQYTVILCLLY